GGRGTRVGAPLGSAPRRPNRAGVLVRGGAVSRLQLIFTPQTYRCPTCILSRAMATRKVSLTVDEELIRRARRLDEDAAGKSDAQVVEDALTVYLALRAVDDARAQGALGAEEADRIGG